MPRAKSATKITKRRPAAAKAKAVSVWHDVLPSRSEQREMKREALLRAAVSAFNRRGFSQTSLDEIAQNLGVTKAALYYYFPTKSALVAACFDRAMKVANESLAIAKRDGRDGREKLILMLRRYLRTMIGELNESLLLTEEHALTRQRSRQADRAARHFRARTARPSQGRHRRRQHRVVRSQARGVRRPRRHSLGAEMVFAQRPLERRTGVDRDQSNARSHAVDHSGKEPCGQRRRYSATRRPPALVAKGARIIRRQHCSSYHKCVARPLRTWRGRPLALTLDKSLSSARAFYRSDCHLTCQSNLRRVSSRQEKRAGANAVNSPCPRKNRRETHGTVGGLGRRRNEFRSH